MGFQFQSVASLSSFVITDLGIDYTQLGLLIGFYLLPGIVIAYPSGLLGRRFGDKQGAMLGMTRRSRPAGTRRCDRRGRRPRYGRLPYAPTRSCGYKPVKIIRRIGCAESFVHQPSR